MFRRLKYIVLPAALLLLGVSCKNFSFSSFLRGDAIATVGDKKLYFEDISSLFTPGIDPQDSLKLLNSYVDNWVKQQLKIQMAETYFTEEQERITQMVNDYRNSLLIYEFEKYYLAERLDTTVTREEINEYYAAHRSEFRLSEMLVKAIVIKFPVGFRQETEMRRLTGFTSNKDQYQNLLDMAIKNNLEYREFSDWTELSEVVALLPRLTEAENSRLRSGITFFEKTQDNMRYFMVLTDMLGEGTPMPVDRAAQTIRTLIMNRRRQEAIKTMEDGLLQAALQSRDVTIQVDTVAVDPVPVTE